MTAGPAQRLHRAASRGDEAAIQALADSEVDVDSRLDRQGLGEYGKSVTPLITAAWSPRGSVNTLRCLVGLGADARLVSAAGVSALHYAALAGSPPKMRYLLELGCDPNERSSGGFTVVMAFAGRAQARGADSNAGITLLANAGADMTAQDSAGFTVLHHAAQADDPECVKYLLDLGMDESIRGTDGSSAVGLCTTIDVERLFSVGRGTRIGSRPELATEYGIDIEELSDSPLYESLIQVDSVTTARLLGDGHDPNSTTAIGACGLHFAVLSPNHAAFTTRVIGLLMNYGARVDTRDCHGRTAVELAFRRLNRAAILTMRSRGADIEQSVQRFGQHIAVMHGPGSAESKVAVAENYCPGLRVSDERIRSALLETMEALHSDLRGNST